MHCVHERGVVLLGLVGVLAGEAAQSARTAAPPPR